MNIEYLFLFGSNYLKTNPGYNALHVHFARTLAMFILETLNKVF